MHNKAEVHIVIDPQDGVTGVQIVGPATTHRQGHDTYFLIQDLVLKLDKEIQERLNQEKVVLFHVKKVCKFDKTSKP